MSVKRGAEHPGIGEGLPDMPAIYLDYNATTPVYPQVAEAMSPFLWTHFGNPSSGHVYGATTAVAVSRARGHVARMLNCAADEIVFTSCGTESDNWAIAGTLANSPPGRKHVVCSAIEHPAVLEALEAWAGEGRCTFTKVPVDHRGVVSVQAVESAMQEDTCLVTIMHSNNEVGSLQPIHDIAHLARSKGVAFHTDAAQSAGKVGLDIQHLGVDMLTLVGHKFGAPKGVAALFVKEGVQLGRFLHGGGQERGQRAGTENVLQIVGLGEAARLVCEEGDRLHDHMRYMTHRLRDALQAGLPEGDCVRLNGPPEDELRLPNTLSISVFRLNAATLLSRHGDRLAASAGAACHSDGSAGLSAVLAAMGISQEWGAGTLRLSTGRHTTEADVQAAADLIVKEVRRQRTEC